MLKTTNCCYRRTRGRHERKWRVSSPKTEFRREWDHNLPVLAVSLFDLFFLRDDIYSLEIIQFPSRRSSWKIMAQNALTFVPADAVSAPRSGSNYDGLFMCNVSFGAGRERFQICSWNGGRRTICIILLWRIALSEWRWHSEPWLLSMMIYSRFGVKPHIWH